MVAFMVCLNFTSCSDDEKIEELTGGANSAIVGTWQVSKVETITKANGEIVGRNVEVSTDDSENYIRVFEADKTWETWAENSAGRWILENSGLWALTTGKLQLSYSVESEVKTETVIVNAISEEELILQFPEKWKNGYYEGNVWVDETTSRIETLTKKTNLKL